MSVVATTTLGSSLRDERTSLRDKRACLRDEGFCLRDYGVALRDYGVALWDYGVALRDYEVSRLGKVHVCLSGDLHVGAAVELLLVAAAQAGLAAGIDTVAVACRKGS